MTVTWLNNSRLLPDYPDLRNVKFWNRPAVQTFAIRISEFFPCLEIRRGCFLEQEWPELIHVPPKMNSFCHGQNVTKREWVIWSHKLACLRQQKYE